MEIRSNPGSQPVQPTPVGRPATRTGRTGESSVDFSSSHKLEDSLRSLPDARPEEVQRGRELVSNTNYPPKVGIEKIAALLAIHLE
jgi:hypothetical protein